MGRKKVSSKHNINWLTILLGFLISFFCIYYIYNLNANLTYSYYVSPNGNDSNVGDKIGPLKTLDGFKALLKEDLEKKIIENAIVNVYIEEGTYRFDSSFTLTGDDLGNKNITVNFIGKNRKNVIFTASEPLKNKLFNEITHDSLIDSVINFFNNKKAYTYDLIAYRLSGKDTAPQLFFNDELMKLTIPSKDKPLEKILKDPNQYYIDYEEKILYFIPPSSIDKGQVELSILNESIIELNNCSNISFKNITIQNTRNNGITIKNSSNIKISTCIIRNTSQTGIYLDNVANSLVLSNTIYNTGSGAIYISGGNRDELLGSNNKISKNNIYDYCKLEPLNTSGISINGVGVTVSSNKIHNGPTTAISFAGNDHIIEYNEIFNVCNKLNNTGAIYSSGDWTYRGNIIRYNNLHDIGYETNIDTAIGIYLGSSVSSASIYKNKFIRVKLAILIDGGRDNVIKENTISNCLKSIVAKERILSLEQRLKMEENLTKVPFSSNIWRKKYPEIKSLDDENKRDLPYGNVIINNNILQSSNCSIDKSFVDNGTVRNNNKK